MRNGRLKTASRFADLFYLPLRFRITKKTDSAMERAQKHHSNMLLYRLERKAIVGLK